MRIKEFAQLLPVLSLRMKAVFAVAALAIGVGGSLIAAEIFLRAIGVPPWKDFKDPLQGPRVLYEPDSKLGWRNRQGTFSIPTRPGSEPFRWTILADGRRSTGPESRPGRPVVALIGCSFTQGIGLSDQETYAWNLQVKNPELAIQNFGTGGFGTYQSLLLLESLFANPRWPRPELVLYGFIEHHEIRNVAAAEWTRLLASTSSRGRVDLPYCSIGVDGFLRRHEPEHYPVLFLMRYSSFVNQLHQSLMNVVTLPRKAQRRRVTERLLAEMDGTCRSEGAPFAVLLLQASRETALHYLQYCKTERIDCYNVLSPMTADFRLSGDTHPNAKQNRIWADQIDDLIGAKLRLRQSNHRPTASEKVARLTLEQNTGVSPGTDQ
jgi:hypothetical protein